MTHPNVCPSENGNPTVANAHAGQTFVAQAHAGIARPCDLKVLLLANAHAGIARPCDQKTLLLANAHAGIARPCDLKVLLLANAHAGFARPCEFKAFMSDPRRRSHYSSGSAKIQNSALALSCASPARLSSTLPTRASNARAVARMIMVVFDLFLKFFE